MKIVSDEHLLKKSAKNVSIMKQLGHEIYMRIVIEQDMSMSEIQKSFTKISNRTIIREVKGLLYTGQITHGRIHGKGKRKRYFVKEENTKQNLTIRSFKIKGKSYKEIRPTITQRNLSSLTTETTQHYKQELKKLKNEPDSNYYTYHIAMISGCLEWVTKLTMAINSGMLGNSPNKLTLAHRNRERYEEFLQKLIFNIKKKDEKLGNEIIRAIYHELVNLWFMEKILP